MKQLRAGWSSFRRIHLAALIADWRRTLLSVIGVALGVTVVLGTLILKSELAECRRTAAGRVRSDASECRAPAPASSGSIRPISHAVRRRCTLGSVIPISLQRD